MYSATRERGMHRVLLEVSQNFGFTQQAICPGVLSRKMIWLQKTAAHHLDHARDSRSGML